MPSTLACLGLDVDDLDQLGSHLEQMTGELVGRTSGPDAVETIRYVDPSGARIVIGRLDGGVVDLVAAYDASPGARLTACRAVGGTVQADVVGPDGATITRLACDLEQLRHLPEVSPEETRSTAFEASVVALGLEMSVHADAAAFALDDASVLGTPEPGDAVTRWSGQSFVSYGLFSTDGDDAAEPTAFLAGEVVAAETREHGVTGQAFHAVRVRTVGFEATVCLAASAHPSAPEPGNVVAGLAYLVADIPALWSIAPSAVATQPLVEPELGAAGEPGEVVDEPSE